MSNINSNSKEIDFNSMTEEEMQKMLDLIRAKQRTHVNKDDNRLLSFAMVNSSREFFQMLNITTTIGYLYQRNDEWLSPTNLPLLSTETLQKNPSLLETPQHVLDSKVPQLIDDYETRRMTQYKREIVLEFLDSVFQFNPKNHLRSAAEKTIDPSVVSRSADNAKKRNVTLVVSKRDGSVREIPHRNEAVDSANVETKGETYAKETIPPVELVYNYNRYYEEHYDNYRALVFKLYSLIPDFEMSIQPINVYSGENALETARLDVEAAQDKLDLPVYVTSFGKWASLAPTAANRANIEAMGKGMDILNKIIENAKNGTKLGSELLKHRVTKAKQENVRREGEHAHAMQSYRRDFAPDSKLATDDATDAPTVSESLQIDEDEFLRVDVWNASDGLKVKKDTIYIEPSTPREIQKQQQ